MPSPILSPESMRLARWQPRHRTPRLRGYVPAQTLCVDLSRCFRLALLSGHRHAYLRIIALSRISAIRLLADASSRASPQQHKLCLLIRSVPLFRLSAGQPPTSLRLRSLSLLGLRNRSEYRHASNVANRQYHSP